MDLSPGKLKSYADAYGLRYSTGVEKGELVDKLISYRVSLIAHSQVSSLVYTTFRDRMDPYPQKMRYVVLDLETRTVHVKLFWAGFLQETFGPQAYHPSSGVLLTQCTPGPGSGPSRNAWIQFHTSVPFLAAGCRIKLEIPPSTPSNKYAADTTPISIQHATSTLFSTTTI